MNYGSEGLWAVGTRIGTIVFKHIEDESPQRYNGSQNVTAISFSTDGKRMLVSGKNDLMLFDF